MKSIAWPVKFGFFYAVGSGKKSHNQETGLEHTYGMYTYGMYTYGEFFYNLLTIASFRIGVPSILLKLKLQNENSIWHDIPYLL